MPRHALGTFFERLVVAALPAVVPACGHPKTTPPPDQQRPAVADMSVTVPPGDLAPHLGRTPVDLMGDDLFGAPDLYGAPPDPCDTSLDPPAVSVLVKPSDVPDGGFGLVCQKTAFCLQHCPNDYYPVCCGPNPGDGGSLVLTCVTNCSGTNPGRRPAGLETATVQARCEVGRWLAGAAHLEAASIHAFAVLERELAGHDAPRRLIAGARRARRDEARHARVTARLARAHGATPAPVRVTRARRRSLEAIAVENAAEGCVRETFAALLARYQARAAADPEVRDVMAELAPDELRHAELAWSVDAWATTRLDSAARKRVRAARAEAVAELAEAVRDPSPALVHAIGLPDGDRALALVAAVKRELWSRG